MSANNFKTLSQAATVTVARKMQGAFAINYAQYGLTTAQATSFTNVEGDYEAAISAFDTAETAFKQAAQDKAAAKLALANKMSDYAKIVYAFPTITDGLIAAAGLAVHNTPAAVSPQPVVQLNAFTSTNGDVKLKWDRSGNAKGVVFNVEFKTAEGEWTFLQNTLATTLRLQGYTPGVQVSFRVIATNRGMSAAASPDVTIYSGGSGFSLKLAA